MLKLPTETPSTIFDGLGRGLDENIFAAAANTIAKTLVLDFGTHHGTIGPRGVDNWHRGNNSSPCFCGLKDHFHG